MRPKFKKLQRPMMMKLVKTEIQKKCYPACQNKSACPRISGKGHENLTFIRSNASHSLGISDVMVGAKCLRILPPSASTVKRKIWPFLLNQPRFQRFLNPDDNFLTIDLEEAFIFFEAMLDCRSLLLHPMSLWTKLVSVVVRGECYYDAIDMYRRIELNWPVSDIRMLSMLENCYCCIGYVDYGFGLLGMIFKRGLDPDVVFFNTLVKGLLLKKRIEEAFWVVCHMGEWGSCSPNEVTFGTLFQGLCGRGHLEIAMELSKKLDSMNLVCYNIIIDGLIRGGLVYQAEEMLTEMRIKGILPDAFTYNSFIYFWSCAAQLEKAKNAVFEMKEQGIYPDVVTYSSLIYGMCRVGQLKEAVCMFDAMKNDALSPNIVTYSSLIDGLCRAGKLEEAMFIFDDMKNIGIAPNVVTCSSIIHGLGCAGMLDKVLCIFDEMKIWGLTPNVLTYGSVIYAFCLLGDLRGAKGILHDMTMNGVIPDLIIYNIIIDGLCSASQTKEAYHIYCSMERKGIPPDVITYNSLIQGFSQVGNWNMVADLLNEMKLNRVFPDAVTYNSIIHSLCQAGELQRARFKFSEMKKNAVFPNIATYNSLIHGMCCARKFEDAKYMLNGMKENGISPNVITYTSIFGGLCEVGNWMEAKQILYQMLAEGVGPNAVTLYVLRRAWLKKRKKNEMVHHLESIIKEQITIANRQSCRKIMR